MAARGTPGLCADRPLTVSLPLSPSPAGEDGLRELCQPLLRGHGGGDEGDLHQQPHLDPLRELHPGHGPGAWGGLGGSGTAAVAWLGTGWCHQDPAGLGHCGDSCSCHLWGWGAVRALWHDQGAVPSATSFSWTRSQQPLGRHEVALVPSASSLSSQMCKKREKRLPDATLEKYVLTVVLDTINAFFSSPFSENSTSLQVTRGGQGGRGRTVAKPAPQNVVWTRVLTLLSPPDPPDHRGAASPVHHEAAGVSVAAAAAQELGGVLHPHAGHGR